eukprot:CAMPEP_0201867158 /NCGR_PEP_ID=MMETSP0902-20130614/1500_1 /ASSEMBLY_ACC=CAM_ASM_000551 /TAXON_ID=420261 /ORGANISM="Thalassiosira antarctica, Strain CCMP982" /LENGTH=495 /DNA_ID=CAMNT_0048392277 /DNA_START=11 /DNA_END=1498 /DNA_ORIENTATION=+
MSADANDSASNAQGVFVYMGQGSIVPEDVIRVRVHPSVRVIAARAFEGCYQLVEVKLSEGLDEIGDWAFYYCEYLKRITIPSSVRRIGDYAFAGCKKLVEVKQCGGLQEIGQGAFAKCKSLNRIALPSSLRVIGDCAFNWCIRLMVVELCEGIQEIGEDAFRNCNSLRNIAIPSTYLLGERMFEVFDCAITLKKAFPSVANSTAISEALKHRFDELPIHKMCYYQQYHPPNNMLRHINEAMGTPEQPNITGTQQDCLGMTPFHILACATKHDMDLYRLLIEKYPNNLINEDKWGDLPILYAVWGNAPRQVVHLLVEVHKTYFPDYALDWGSMVVTLGEANEPDGIQDLFDMQQNHFSNQNMNWEECAVELARSERASTTTFQLLLTLSVANRLDALGVGKWHTQVENFINECSYYDNAAEKQARLLYSNLTSCEQLKEATWLLELAVWKAKIDESTSNIHGQDHEERNQCRINCGVQQILPFVVSFLTPKWDSSL